jgi:hypothetical protein
LLLLLQYFLILSLKPPCMWENQKKNTPIKTQPSLDAANLSRASSLAGPTWPQKNIGWGDPEISNEQPINNTLW